MGFIRDFNDITKRDVAIAGGKGASLGELTRAGIRVPPGFVVVARAFDQFLQETDLDAEIEAILKKVNHKDINSVDKASVEIRALISDEEMPHDLQEEIMRAYQRFFHPSLTLPIKGRERKKKVPPPKGRARPSLLPPPWWGRQGGGLVAVRSSATAEDSKVASWAGELETYLNVTERKVIDYVIKCWSSLFTPRAIFYRYEKKLHKKPVSVAVVVQAMIQSEVSGICFTVHPVTEDRNQMVIEAGFGLGEAIVSGQVTPDTYVIHKKDFSILDINVAQQSFYLKQGPRGRTIRANWRIASEGGRQKLSGKKIVELTKLCKKIEQHYRYPQDIEWAYAKGKFYITQSRPITTLK